MLAFVVVATMLGGPASGAEAQESGTQQPPTQDAPVISAPAGSQTIGARVLITGAGWAPFATLSAAVCGNRGINGSADCTSLGGSFFSRSNGAVVFEDVLAKPPLPCPCVVSVREVEGGGEATAPIEILGMEVPVTLDSPVPTAIAGTAQLVVDQVRVVGGGWTSWFGLPSERTLEVVVSNRSATAVTSPPFSAAWGRGPDGAKLIVAPTVDDVRPGETVTLSADFSTGPFARGTYGVNGRVGPPWAPAAFGSSFTTWPWALLVLLVIAGAFVVFRVIRRRQRARPKAADSLPPPPAAAVSPSAPESSAGSVSSAEVSPSAESLPLAEPPPPAGQLPLAESSLAVEPPPSAEVIDLRDSAGPVPVSSSIPVDASALEDDLAEELGRVLAAAGPLGPENHPELVAASVAAEVAAVVGARHHLPPEAVEAMAADLSESLTLALG